MFHASVLHCKAWGNSFVPVPLLLWLEVWWDDKGEERVKGGGGGGGGGGVGGGGVVVVNCGASIGPVV